jgi:hypothetical protein
LCIIIAKRFPSGLPPPPTIILFCNSVNSLELISLSMALVSFSSWIAAI